MRKISWLICICLFIAVFSSVAFADYPDGADVIGFSHNGKYFAFADYGLNDDEDDKSSYSTMYIINVAKNSLAVAPFKAEGRWNRKGTLPLHRTYGQDVKKRLKRFGIGEGFLDHTFEATLGRNPGDPESRPRNGERLPTNLEFTSQLDLPFEDRPKFEVKINKILVPRENCSEFNRDMFSFEMILNRKNREPITLQKAGKTCADAYGLDQICLYRNKIAVVVASLSKNSKGPDNRYLVVTGVFSEY